MEPWSSQKLSDQPGPENSCPFLKKSSGNNNHGKAQLNQYIHPDSSYIHPITHLHDEPIIGKMSRLLLNFGLLKNGGVMGPQRSGCCWDRS
jgi:hypothetical protein